ISMTSINVIARFCCAVPGATAAIATSHAHTDTIPLLVFVFTLIANCPPGSTLLARGSVCRSSAPRNAIRFDQRSASLETAAENVIMRAPLAQQHVILRRGRDETRETIGYDSMCVCAGGSSTLRIITASRQACGPDCSEAWHHLRRSDQLAPHQRSTSLAGRQDARVHLRGLSRLPRRRLQQQARRRARKKQSQGPAL